MMVADHGLEHVLGLVRRESERYAARWGGDPEDVCQQVLSMVGESVREGRADWALIVIAIRNAIAHVARDDRRMRRCPNIPVVSAHSGIAAREVITDQERIELRLDIDACLEREGESVRRLCSLLETMTLSEAAAVMDVPRSTLRGWLASLRERMEAKGLGPR